MGTLRPVPLLLITVAAAVVAIPFAPDFAESAPESPGVSVTNAPPARNQDETPPSSLAAIASRAKILGFVTDEWGIPITGFQLTGRLCGEGRRRRSVGSASDRAPGMFQFELHRPDLLFEDRPTGGRIDRGVFRISADGYADAKFTATRAEWEALERGEDVGGVTMILMKAARR